MRLRTTLLASLALAAGAYTAANAAEPSSGTISASSPRVEWGGTLASSGITNNVWSEDASFPCNPPACDSFALTVADPGLLTITLNMLSTNADGSDPGCGVRLIKPDGNAEWFDGSCSEASAMKVTVKNAPAGEYTVDVASSHVCCGTEDYRAAAFLPSAAAPAPASAGPVAPAAPAAAEVRLTAKAPSLSAKKLKKARKFTVALKSTGPLTNVNALLVTKKKKVGSGKLASLSGSGKLIVKVKGKLRPGAYQLSVGGKDSQGRNVVTAVKLKIKK